MRKRILMSTKSRFLIMVLALFIAVAGTACISKAPPVSAVPQTPALTTVKVGYAPLVSNGPLFIAMDEGYFARQGITVELVKIQNGPDMIPPLVNGDIAAGGSGISAALINAVSKGGHVRIVADKGRAAPNQSCNTSGIMVRRDLFLSGAVTKASDLKGKKIAVPSIQDYRISRILRMGNLTSDDVEINGMDFASSVLALRNGAVDAADLTEPYITQLLDDNVAVMLIPTEESCPDFPTPLYYGTTFLDKDPELGRRFMIAYLEGVRQYNLGKTDRNLKILSNYTPLDRDLLQRCCWVPIARDGNLPWQPFRDYMDWMYANKKITQIVEESQLFDMSYVNYANGVLAKTSSTG
jgi:NitT/TauT family transport system substrate-binding protein